MFGWLPGGSFDDMPHLDYVISCLSRVNLIGRGTRPLYYRSSNLAYVDARSAMLGRLVTRAAFASSCYTAKVVRLVISPAALFPLGRASTDDLEAPICEARRCIFAITLRVSKALAALAM